MVRPCCHVVVVVPLVVLLLVVHGLAGVAETAVIESLDLVGSDSRDSRPVLSLAGYSPAAAFVTGRTRGPSLRGQQSLLGGVRQVKG